LNINFSNLQGLLTLQVALFGFKKIMAEEVGRQKCNSSLWSEMHFCGIWSNPISKTLPD